jgi:SP family myo-inositol transporter-like MFS transporter 13
VTATDISTAHATPARTGWYGRYLILIAGLGGLLYGIDVGIIAAALLYLNKTVSLSVGQTSIVVAAVLGGGMVSSPVAGVLADWVGRKRMMLVGGLLFVASVGVIVLSQSFAPLFLGRVLQGMSGGVIAVVVPLFLAESLSPETRGRGTAIFQFLLTVGIVLASVTGYLYTHNAEAAIAAAHGNQTLILAAENHAWRGMFLSVVYPGLAFFVGCFFLSETPRWLYRKGRRAEALAALRRTGTEAEAELQMREMEATASVTSATTGTSTGTKPAGSLLQRRYVVPFVLACIVLACNQATGINSVLGFLVIILRQAGMTASHATAADVAVKLLNMVMTIVAVALVDRKGRRWLLKLGTAGIILALLAGAAVFYTFESQRTNVTADLRLALDHGTVQLPVTQQGLGIAKPFAQPMSLTVLYTYGSGDRTETVLTTDADPTVHIAPLPTEDRRRLAIERASFGPVPTERTGWLVAACLALFIAAFSIGPGVVVWLMLSELMPTRIRSTGMGIALLLNQGVSTVIAGVFLPVVSHYGYYAMFLFWAACTVVYFLTAAFFLPETKGKTLEEIELYFERRQPF